MTALRGPHHGHIFTATKSVRAGRTDKMLEQVVQALMTLIETRDPSTFGHAERVAKLTLALAEAVDRCNSGPYKDIHFTPEEMLELRYASLLHDIGNIGVPEEVLVKAKKLHPLQLDLIRKRFRHIRQAVELEYCRRKLNWVLQNGNQNIEEFFRQIDADQESQFRTLDDFLQVVLHANDPTVLPEKSSEQLVEMAGWTFQGTAGPTEPLLTAEELRFLTIPKGSLDPYERIQIGSHVIHSFRFLSQIPWTKELKNVPIIAKAHHEKLDGSGYPYQMKAEEIPFQAKMMTICDIFDALTAHDKGYKKAVPVERALAILSEEVYSNLLDPELFRLFVETKVYRVTDKRRSAQEAEARPLEKCPQCGSVSLEIGVADLGNMTFTLAYSCQTCAYEWRGKPWRVG
jgi:response regulator RpfG family c-di-GMP phosphodiesterase